MNRPKAEIYIKNSSRAFTVNIAKTKLIIRFVQDCLGVSHLNVSVLVCGDSKIRTLNQAFRDKNRATDVLSFPQIQWNYPLKLVRKKNTRSKTTRSNDSLGELGDIIISAPATLRNAQQIGQSIDREFAFLLVHGILHLCGHDHIEPKDEKLMLPLQRKIMSQIEKLQIWKASLRRKGIS